MKISTEGMHAQLLLRGVLFVLISAVAVSAQSLPQGENAVWTSSQVAGSTAFIDASAFCGSGGSHNCGGSSYNFCAPLAQALIVALSAGGGVVDARGIVLPPSSGTGGGGSQLCTADPFSTIGSGNAIPITVLLPASTIIMSQTWVLPDNVRLVGEGQYTILRASFASGDVIDMGSSSLCTSNVCSGISIQHVSIEGPGGNCGGTGANALNGIVNNYAQESSYVDGINMCAIGYTGIKITSGAANSGPYTNINFNSPNLISCTYPDCPVCVDIEVQTKGAHGLSCIGSPATANSTGDAAIYVNASNNTVEDVHTEGFYDSVELGPVANVGNIIVSNVTGGNSAAGATTNTIHICGPNHPTFGQCAGGGSAHNVSIFEVLNAGQQYANVTSIQDDVTGTSIAQPAGGTGNIPSYSDAYFLGDEVGGVSGQYSRFATTPSASSSTSGSTAVTTWGVGGISGGSITGTSCASPGALFSNTLGNTSMGNMNSVYVCTYSNGWQPIS